MLCLYGRKCEPGRTCNCTREIHVCPQDVVKKKKRLNWKKKKQNKKRRDANNNKKKGKPMFDAMRLPLLFEMLLIRMRRVNPK